MEFTYEKCKIAIFGYTGVIDESGHALLPDAISEVKTESWFGAKYSLH